MPTAQATANRNLDSDYGSGTPATIYACLTTVLPNPNGNGTIVQPTQTQYQGYAEQAITNSAANWPPSVNGVKQNAVAFNFPPAGAASTGTPLTHLVFRTDTTANGGGRIIDYIALPANTAVVVNQGLLFQANGVQISEA